MKKWMLFSIMVFSILGTYSYTYTAAAAEDTEAQRQNQFGIQLLDAIRHKKIKTVKKLIFKGAPVNYCNNNGKTPLLIALLYKRENMLQILIDARADTSQANKYGETPLMLAKRWNNAYAIKTLLNATDTAVKNTQTQHQNQLDEQLLDTKNTQIQCQNQLSEQLLDAIFNEKIKLVKQLIAEGAPVNYHYKVAFGCGDENKNMYSKHTPLTIVLYYRRNNIILNILLDAHADVNQANKNGNTPLIIAAANNNVYAIKTLLSNNADIDKKNIDGYTALMCARLKGYYNTIEELILNGADVNLTNNNGETALTVVLWEKEEVANRMQQALEKRQQYIGDIVILFLPINDITKIVKNYL